MINPFNLNYFERLRYISNLRERIKEKYSNDEDSVKKIFLDCFELFKFCPKVNIAFDKENIKEWPSLWELIRYNEYDEFSVVYMMAEIFVQAQPSKREKIKILVAKDLENSRMLDIISYKGDKEEIYFTSQGEFLKNNDLENFYIIETFYRLNSGWKKI